MISPRPGSTSSVATSRTLNRGSTREDVTDHWYFDGPPDEHGKLERRGVGLGVTGKAVGGEGGGLVVEIVDGLEGDERVIQKALPGMRAGDSVKLRED